MTADNTVRYSGAGKRRAEVERDPWLGHPAFVGILLVIGLVAVLLFATWFLVNQGQLLFAGILILLVLVAMVVGAMRAFRSSMRSLGIALLAAVVMLVGAGGAYAWLLNDSLGQIARINDDDLSEGTRPDPAPGEAQNILLLGADNGDMNDDGSTKIADLMKDGSWDPGAYRSDTIMLVHIPASRQNITVLSIPRDTYATLYDSTGEEKGKSKINAAFSDYGPLGTLRTVENLTNIRIDHLAIVDWRGFQDITEAIGGVTVYIPETFEDTKQKITWEKGENHLEGFRALQYVRTRYGLANSDFDRVARQQNFIRAVMKKMLSNGTISNPIKLNNALRAITSNLTVDSDWSSSDIRDLAFNLRDLNVDDVTFLTLPNAGFEAIDGIGDVNIVDEKKAKQLYRAIRTDSIEEYLQKYPGDKLAGEKGVS